MDKETRQMLCGMNDRKYSDFSSSLIPGADNIIGIRLPVLRKMARKLAAEKGRSALSDEEDIYFEETMLRGMIIGYLKLSTQERLELIRSFIPEIDNWSVCDSFCCTLKFPQKDIPLVLEFIKPYAYSDKEFEQRFAAVMLLRFFVNDEYIDGTLSLLSEINTEAYYSSMAVAWTAAECYIRFPVQTLPYLRDAGIEKETQKIAVLKICDSFRVDRESKEMLKKL